MTDHVRRITELTRQLVERPLTAEEQRARDLREAGERAVADAIAAQVGMTARASEVLAARSAGRCCGSTHGRFDR